MPLVLLLTSVLTRAAGAAPETPGAQWPKDNNGLDGQRFSPLKQITPINARELHVAMQAPNLANSAKLYSQVCVSCHWPEGDLISGHDLRSLVPQPGKTATIAYVKDPEPPMPKLYPALLTEQDVHDVAAYLVGDFGR